MARITTRRVVDVVGHAAVVRIRIRLAVRMTVNAGEGGVVRRINVTRRAGSPYSGVRSGINREPGVIKRRSRPRRGVVAQRAGGGEGRRRVIGISSALVIRLVAGVAVRRCSCIPPVNVATGAGHGRMCPGKRPTSRAVIETGRNPRRRGVAHLALLREASRCVVRIIGVLKIF